MSVSYTQDFLVDSRDVDLTGYARPSAVLGYLQEMATVAAGKLHVSGPETRAKYNCFWMIVRMWVKLDEPLRWNDTFTIHTWHRGAKGASSYRDFDIIRDGKVIGEAVSTWVLADCDDFSLLRLDKLEEFHTTDGGELCKSIKLHRVKLPAELPGEELRPMRYSDTDINSHVNNARYADFACDALHMEDKLDGKFIREFQLSYASQCMAGETVTLQTAVEGDSCWARGVGADGKERFESVFHLAPLP